MNGRVAKKLRRENSKELPELNMSFGRNRAGRRETEFKNKDRSFTRPGRQFKVWDRKHKTFVWRKAMHIVQDYSYQREAIR